MKITSWVRVAVDWVRKVRVSPLAAADWTLSIVFVLIFAFAVIGFVKACT